MYLVFLWVRSFGCEARGTILTEQMLEQASSATTIQLLQAFRSFTEAEAEGWPETSEEALLHEICFTARKA